VVEMGDKLLAKDGCLNFFAGPSNTAFSAEMNFYNVHYASTHIVGTSGGEYTLYAGDGETLLATKPTLSELISSLTEPDGLSFRDVVTDESIELPRGSYTLEGSLTVLSDGIITVPTGTEVTVNATVKFGDGVTASGGYMRIKGGSVTLDGGSVFAGEGVGILIDYSSRSSFTLNSGSVVAKNAAAIEVKSGEARLLGGGAYSTYSYAIKNSSTLLLSCGAVVSGHTYDIFTEAPISIYASDIKPSAAYDVIFNKCFDNGTMSEVLYNCTEDTLDYINLYDKDGERCELCFFESSKYTAERNFLAVYKPFTVTYKSKGEVIGRKEYLLGEACEEIVSEETLGYEFYGWYTDSSFTEEYDFATKISSDITLYKKSVLSAPQFRLLSMTFTYDTLAHSLEFLSLTHPLENEGKFYFEWFCNGEFVSSKEKLDICEVADSGSYFCKIKFAYAGDFVEITTPEINVTVEKMTVATPEIISATYNGYPQYAQVSASTLYKIEELSATNAGKYAVKIELTDTSNTAWEGSTESFVYADFIIEQAENSWVSEPHVSPSYEGFSPSVTALSKYGEVSYYYSTAMDGSYTESYPKSRGTYYLIAKVAATDNYKELVSAPVAFQILEEKIAAIFVQTMPDKLVYKAFEEFNPQGLCVIGEYNSKRREEINLEELTFTYQSGSAFTYGDSAITVSFGAQSVLIPLTVKKAEYDLSGILFGDAICIYNGKFQTLSSDFTLPTGLDGIKLQAYVSGGGTAVGTYTVSLVFESDSENYEIPEPISATLTVEPLTVAVKWKLSDFIYDGTPKAPSASFVNENGAELPLSVTGAKINAGEGYIARIVSPSANYRFENAEVIFSVGKADYDFSTLGLDKDEFIFDGEQKRVSAVGLPQGVEVIGYTDNKGTEAGIYVTVLTLSYDETNYNPPVPPRLTWEIKKASYSLSGFEFYSPNYVYDGKMHYPTLSGQMPVGADGIALSYTFIGGAVNVDGANTVEVKFSTESKNYFTPDSIFIAVNILPMEIEVEWSQGEFTYDGAYHLPSAISPLTLVKVSGAKLDAGKYTARAVSQSANYKIKNDTLEFVIKKSENYWLKAPTVKNVYEGTSPSPMAEAAGGEVSYLYYRVGEDVALDTVGAAGKYYMIATAKESKNYKSLSSSPVYFEVYPLTATELEVILLSSGFGAFERVEHTDFEAYVHYSDGTRVEIPSENVTVCYQSADSLRATDTALSFSFARLTDSVAITVKKADYDLSGIKWLGSEVIYSAEEQSISISGLPEGVSVREQIGGRGVFAGEYPVTVYLDYDTENYNQPPAISGTLVIAKRVLEAPSEITLIYNGEQQAISLPSGFVAVGEYVIKEAGDYLVKIAVLDTKNTALADGEYAEITVTVKKTPVTVRVEDITLYLFEELGEIAYEITEGTVFGNDSLMIEFSESDGALSVKSSNPSYDVTLIGGRVERLKRMSPAAMRTMLLTAVFVIFIGLFSFALINKKDLITDTIARARGAVACVRKKPAMQPLLVLPPPTSAEFDAKISVDREEADNLISDSMAKGLIKKQGDTVKTNGWKKAIVNIELLEREFSSGERVDINVLKERALIAEDVGYIKILADGALSKPLSVYANAFSLSAVKMIALTGGEAIKVQTVR
ncbi:MAG: uL15 family ribosomal protein, partial [Clostridia bacterium]|nr:uL15 family ribosomal protein [Clostridia bacterium]